MKIVQKGFNYSQDGDGNRLVYHLQGCNMSCPWCANPEAMSVDGVLVACEEWVIASVCPHGAISGTKLDRSVCENCKDLECIRKHRTKGLSLSYQEASVEEIVEEIQSSQMMFYDGGGVTFTGGEATLQFEELKSVLMQVKAGGIHTAIETNGTHKRLPGLFPYIDQLIMDCKLCDSQKHKEMTGVPNEQIMDNIRAAAKTHPKLHVRVPLIGGVNDSEKDRADFISFFKEIMGENVTFEVLTYHEFGKKKWEECGLTYEMTKEAFVDEDIARQFIEAIKSTGAHYKRT